jgi:hypothetical protein
LLRALTRYASLGRVPRPVNLRAGIFAGLFERLFTWPRVHLDGRPPCGVPEINRNRAMGTPGGPGISRNGHEIWPMDNFGGARIFQIGCKSLESMFKSTKLLRMLAFCGMFLVSWCLDFQIIVFFYAKMTGFWLFGSWALFFEADFSINFFGFSKHLLGI